MAEITWIYLAIGICFLVLIPFFFFLEVFRDKWRKWHNQIVVEDKGNYFRSIPWQGVKEKLADFALFSQGPSGYRKADHALWGVADGVNWALFDFVYKPYPKVRPSAQNEHANPLEPSSMMCQTVAFAKLDHFSFPRFFLQPRDAKKRAEFRGLDSILTTSDIRFERHPQFSRRYRLTGASEDQIRSLFTDDILTFLEFDRENYFMEANGPVFLLYSVGHKVPSNGLIDFGLRATQHLRVFIVAHYKRYFDEHKPQDWG